MKRWQAGGWMAGRARNALRRRARIVVVSGFAFVGALVAFVLIPRRASQVATVAESRIPDRPDSQPTINARAQALAQIAATDSQLAGIRRQAVATLAQTVDTLPLYLVPLRDSLTREVAALNRLIARAQSAPLPSSYRALGGSAQLRQAPIVQSLLDSLTTIERERDMFGALGGVDPVYIALTARANAIGRTLVDIGAAQRSELRAELAPLRPPRATAPTGTTIDTLPLHAARAQAAGVLASANQSLSEIRGRNAEIDSLTSRARHLANVDAPPWAMLASALVIALALGFAVSLFAEMAKPHIADVREAEKTAGTRVLTVVQPREQIAERTRRQADEEAPQDIDVVSDTYRLLYLHLSSLDAPVRAVTVTGDDMHISSIVAVNLAAVAAYEARSTLVIDADPLACGVAGALRISPDPGLTSVLAGKTSWSEAVVFTTIGRDQTMDVMPSGRRAGQPSPDAAGKIRADLERVSSRYDMVVVVAPVAQARPDISTIIPGPDVILCARMARTPLRELTTAVEALRGAGMRVHGLVLWNTEPPRLATREELLAAGSARPRAEMETAAR